MYSSLGNLANRLEFMFHTLIYQRALGLGIYCYLTLTWSRICKFKLRYVEDNVRSLRPI